MIDRRLLIDQRTYNEYDEKITNVIWIGLTQLAEYSKLDDKIIIDVKDGAGIITGSNERSARYRTVAIEGNICYEHTYDMVNWLPKVGFKPTICSSKRRIPSGVPGIAIPRIPIILPSR